MTSQASPSERFAHLSATERGWVAAFHTRARELLGPRLRDLRLFGSKARGDHHPESDVDLLVLVDDLDYETWKAVIHLAYEISAWLSPLVKDFDRYHEPASRATGLYQEMRKDSIRL